jgi:TatD DNase family protein
MPAIEVARRNVNVWAAVGFHPHEAKDFDAAAEEQTRRLAAEPEVVAIGEIGLDYFYDHSPRDTQRDVFLRQVAIARDLNLPVIIHNRDSTSDLLELLRSDETRGVIGVIHSFTESLTVASEMIDRGF